MTQFIETLINEARSVKNNIIFNTVDLCHSYYSIVFILQYVSVILTLKHMGFFFLSVFHILDFSDFSAVLSY